MDDCVLGIRILVLSQRSSRLRCKTQYFGLVIYLRITVLWRGRGFLFSIHLNSVQFNVISLLFRMGISRDVIYEKNIGDPHSRPRVPVCFAVPIRRTPFSYAGVANEKWTEREWKWTTEEGRLITLYTRLKRTVDNSLLTYESLRVAKCRAQNTNGIPI